MVREPHFCFKSNSSVMRKSNDGEKACSVTIPSVYQMEEILLIVKNGFPVSRLYMQS